MLNVTWIHSCYLCILYKCYKFRKSQTYNNLLKHNWKAVMARCARKQTQTKVKDSVSVGLGLYIMESVSRCKYVVKKNLICIIRTRDQHACFQMKELLTFFCCFYGGIQCSFVISMVAYFCRFHANMRFTDAKTQHKYVDFKLLYVPRKNNYVACQHH